MPQLPSFAGRRALRSGVALFVLGLVTSPLYAQPAPPPAAEEEADVIIVTGSRIARPELETASPVSVISIEQIKSTGDVNLSNYLSQTPALVGSLVGERNAGSNVASQSVGLDLLDLRNLGTKRTLVVINGRRHVNSYPGESSVDINTIPVDLIENVQVLTGGASAVYGADAVSGVVNFIMKRDFEGIRARGQLGISERGDNAQRFGSIIAGHNFSDGRGNITAAYEYSKEARFSQRQRSYTGNPAKRWEILRDPADFPDNPNVPDRIPFINVGWADSSIDGAVDVDLDGIPDFDGLGRPYDGGQFLSGSGGRAINGSSNTPTAGYFGDFTPALRKHNFNMLGHYDFSEAFRLSFEAKYVTTKAMTEVQPSFDFGTYLTPDNAYLLQRFGGLAPDGAFVNRDNFDFGTRDQISKRDTFRAVIAADGDISGEDSGNLKYELSYVYGRSKSVTRDTSQRVVDRYFAALDAVDDGTGNITCRINLPGETIIDPNNYAGVASIGGVTVTGAPLTFTPGQCVPLNILGNGTPSQAALDFILANDITRARSTQHVVSGAIRGDLGFLFNMPGGPISFAVGGEYRKESTQSTPSDFATLGAFDGGTRSFAAGGSYNVKEVFAELVVPLLKDAPLAYNLSLEGAIRFSDYSSIGSTTTWKVGGNYAPIRDVAFRGTYSQAVRAPNITELFSPDQGTFQFLNDPCDPTFIGEGGPTRVANCNAQLVAAGLTPAQIAAFSPSTDAEQSTSQPGVTGGNPNLQEETAKTWTAGVVLQPSFIRGFTFTADWYDIKIKNAVNTPTANEVFENCVDGADLSNPFCALFTRAPGTGFINSFQVRAQNVASFKTSGLEMTANYVFRTADSGTFRVGVSGGYLKDLSFVPSIGGAPDQDRDEPYAPKYLGTVTAAWENGPLELSYKLSWQSKTRRYTTEQLTANPDLSDPKYFWLKERWEHDIGVSYTVQDKFKISAGIQNLTDQKPAFAWNAGYPVSAVGRFFYIGAQIDLDDIF